MKVLSFRLPSVVRVDLRARAAPPKRISRTLLQATNGRPAYRNLGVWGLGGARGWCTESSEVRIPTDVYLSGRHPGAPIPLDSKQLSRSLGMRCGSRASTHLPAPGKPSKALNKVYADPFTCGLRKKDSETRSFQQVPGDRKLAALTIA